jgi:hypothetical protein
LKVVGGIKMSVKRLTLIALSVCVLVVQEFLLSSIPNVQITTLLIVVYSRNYSFKEMLILLTCYVLLDNLVIGPFRIENCIAMIIAWVLLMLVLKTIFKKVKSELHLAIIGGVFGFIYCWIFVLNNLFILDSKAIVEYMIADIPFELIFVAINFITIYLLFKPLNIFFQKYNLNKY